MWMLLVSLGERVHNVVVFVVAAVAIVAVDASVVVIVSMALLVSMDWSAWR